MSEEEIYNEEEVNKLLSEYKRRFSKYLKESDKAFQELCLRMSIEYDLIEIEEGAAFRLRGKNGKSYINR